MSKQALPARIAFRSAYHLHRYEHYLALEVANVLYSYPEFYCSDGGREVEQRLKSLQGLYASLHRDAIILKAVRYAHSNKGVGSDRLAVRALKKQ